MRARGRRPRRRCAWHSRRKRPTVATRHRPGAGAGTGPVSGSTRDGAHRPGAGRRRQTSQCFSVRSTAPCPGVGAALDPASYAGGQPIGPGRRSPSPVSSAIHSPRARSEHAGARGPVRPASGVRKASVAPFNNTCSAIDLHQRQRQNRGLQFSVTFRCGTPVTFRGNLQCFRIGARPDVRNGVLLADDDLVNPTTCGGTRSLFQCDPAVPA